MMQTAAALRSGKSFRDENFPVASRLIEPRFRRPIMAFYEFARTADDIADHGGLRPGEKLLQLQRLEDSLLGRSNAEPVGITLRDALSEAGLRARHARDLLAAFRLDVCKQRYETWTELLDYCRLSAMPVGRFVLDVHGEERSTWAASDALCAALQIVNHMQDCAEDFRMLDRVYIPLELLQRHGATVEHLADPRCSPALRACLNEMCARVSDLLGPSNALARQVSHARLGLEISVIQHLAEQLVRTLLRHDPLSERAAPNAFEVLLASLQGLVDGASQRAASTRIFRRRDTTETGEAQAGRSSGASGSTFYAAMRVLPREKREAVFSIYAFCRAVDDIADEPGDRGGRMAMLDHWRRDLDGLYRGQVPAGLATLSKSIGAFDLKQEDFHSVILGMQMDIEADICAPAYATLDLYCDRVASAVGRLCVRVFEMPKQAGVELAHHLGRALQFTNILRDIDEDAAIGRVYLPREMLVSCGITDTDPQSILRHPALAIACERLAQHALVHFREAEAVMHAAPPATVRCARIMAVAYRCLLLRLLQRGWAMPRERVHLGRGQIASIVLRSYLNL